MEDDRDSFVSFQMKSALTGAEYKQFIADIIEAFILFADPTTAPNWAKFEAQQHRWNEESRLSMFLINGETFGSIKFYTYDEINNNGPRLIVIRDHYSAFDVEKVYLVADKFEEFLKSRGIDYTRHNRTR